MLTITRFERGRVSARLVEKGRNASNAMDPGSRSLLTIGRALPATAHSVDGAAQPETRYCNRFVAVLLAIVVSGISGTASAAGTPDGRLSDHAWVSWNTSYGLFPGPFRAIAEDHDGYLWLGVSGDLVRFDGVRFVDAETITHGTWLNKGVITVLTAARDGSIWVGRSTGGVSRLKDGHVANFGIAEGVPEGSITSIVEDAASAIWVGTRFGLRRFVDGRWLFPVGPDHVPSDPVDSLFEDRAGNLWLANARGLFVRPIGKEPFVGGESDSQPVGDFAEDAAGALWAADRTRGFRLVKGVSRLGRAHLPSTRTNGTRLLVDRGNNLWVATRGQGLLRIFADERGNPIVQHLGTDEGLSSDITLALFEDSNGNIWVGTENSLVRITAVKGISVEGVSAAHQTTFASDGSVWIGATDGLYRVVDTRRRRYSEADGLPSSTITGLASSSPNQLWVATDRGLARIDGDKVHALQFPSGFRPTGVTALTVDHDGALWFCDSQAGVFRWSGKDLHSFRGDTTVDRRRCPSAMTDRDGRVWFGFSDGTLAVLHRGSFRQYTNLDGLTGGIVTAIYQDHEGTIWIGTNKGISRLDGDHFVSFTQQNGMPAKAISGIVDDDQGFVWFSTITGIVRVDRTEFEHAAKDPKYRIRYTLFDTADGLPGPPLYLGSPNATRSTDGRLWFVTTAGVAVIDPRQVRRAPQRASPRIESLSANGIPVEPSADVKLPPNIGELFINYTALNFTSAAKTRFRYRLDGFDTDWVDAGSRREAIYTHLPPGQYTFRLEAGIDGSWDENSAALALSIAPTFYQTPWFFGGTAVAVLLGIVVAWKRRFARATREFAMVYEERARMAREIHDTLLQSLLGVALQFDVIAQTLEASPRAAREHLVRARDEVESYIREARQSIWDLRSPAVQAQGLAAALKSTCEKVAVATGVQCEFVITGSAKRFPLRAEEQLFRIGQEAVTNAIRHASPQRIQVMLDYDDRNVHLRVSDDGRGFDPSVSPAEQEGHWGLADMRERAKRIGAKFTLSTEPGQGTRIETTVPFKLAS